MSRHTATKVTVVGHSLGIVSKNCALVILSHPIYRGCTCADHIRIFAIASACWNLTQDYYVWNAEGVLSTYATK
jgi:hypothetical protein